MFLFFSDIKLRFCIVEVLAVCRVFFAVVTFMHFGYFVAVRLGWFFFFELWFVSDCDCAFCLGTFALSFAYSVDFHRFGLSICIFDVHAWRGMFQRLRQIFNAFCASLVFCLNHN